MKHGFSSRWLVVCGILSCLVALTGAIIQFTSPTNALQVDIRKADSTITLTMEYANTTASDQTLYLAGRLSSTISSNISSGNALEISDIQHTYPMRYTAPVGLSTINSGDSKTTNNSVKPSDASFVNTSNDLSFVLTPNLSNRCGKLNEVKGCVWDIGKRNQWNTDTLSCLGSTTNFSCGGQGFNTSETNVVPAGMGGKFTITIKVRGGLDKEVLYYFPAEAYQFTPGSPITKSKNLLRPITVFLTERAVVSTSVPSFSSSTSSSVSTSASSSPSVSSSASSVPSSSSSASVSTSVSSSVSVPPQSSAPATSKTPLSTKDVVNLSINCQASVIGTTTTCSFALPSDKTLPADTTISIGSGPSSPCTSAAQQVECLKVPVGQTVGQQSISVRLGVASTSTNALQSATVVAKVEDLVRTGAGDLSYIIFLFGFIGVSVLAYVMVNRPKPKMKISI